MLLNRELAVGGSWLIALGESTSDKKRIPALKDLSASDY